MILKVPSKLGHLGNSSTNIAPDKIIKEINEIFWFDLPKVEEIKVENDIIKLMKDIENKVLNIKEKIVILGGDHSITYGAVKGIKPEILLWFDAHLDCVNDFFISHEDVLRNIRREFPNIKIYAFGIRNYTKEELEFATKNNINVFSVEETLNFDFSQFKEKKVYVSLDIDAIDPGFAPGTYWKEPGGFSSREILNIISKLKFARFMDIVEVDPKLDFNNITSRLAAYLVTTFME